MIITVDYFKLVGLIIMVILFIICILGWLISTSELFKSIEQWKRERKRRDDKEEGDE